MAEIVIIGLLVYTLTREAIYLYSMHKLVNKLMSRNYHEYKSAEEVYKPKQAQMPVESPIEGIGIMDDFIR